MLPLIESGVVNNSMKSTYRGRTISAFLSGHLVELSSDWSVDLPGLKGLGGRSRSTPVRWRSDGCSWNRFLLKAESASDC